MGGARLCPAEREFPAVYTAVTALRAIQAENPRFSHADPTSADSVPLPEPHGGAPVYRDHDPGTKPNAWRHFVDLLAGRRPSDRKWDEER